LRLVLAAVGKRDPFARETADYLGRAGKLSRRLGLSGPDLLVVEAPKALSGLQRQEKEAALLLGALPDRARLVLLDERGAQEASHGIAELIAGERARGAPELAFLIGGADGFAPRFAEGLGARVAARIAFGRATWPHMLVRLMLAEQLYRAATILTGHPYHRA
jgi:23S rRNA (pseudouridine1915-N3)-methyltransferase